MAIVEFDKVVYAYEAQGAAHAVSPVADHAANPAAIPSTNPAMTPPANPAANPSTDPSTTARPALDGISLEVEPGEFVAVIGANGSGKSTLARHINALLTPSSGRVLTCGMNTSLPELTFEVRSHAGYLFQNPDSQMVTSVVADDVAFGPENLAVSQQEIVERVDEALGSVAMQEYALRNPAHLSGGQKQRVCLAGVLAMRPDVLVLDEPGAMLDMRGRRGIRRIVRELSRQGMTVILITHFMEEAILAKRVFALDHGRIALAGTPVEVFSQKQRLRELSLDVPFSLLLAEELRKRGLDVPEIVSPEELKEVLCRWYSNR